MIDKKSRVLIADDFELARSLLRKSLQEMEITQVDEARDGEETFRKLEQAHEANQPYALVLLDWTMPRITGLSVLQMCRSDERFVRLPIMMVTAESERSFIVQALAAGATDYLVKPLSTKVLRNKLEALNKRLKEQAA